MTITGGFGQTLDIETGIARNWTMGKDGVKRWVDTGEPCDHDRARTRRVIAHVDDAGPDARRFACQKCGWVSDWIFDHMTPAQIKKGIPCARCNNA